ncbi:hypothetical protein [Rhizobium sp. BK602]|uniref:hypothetical protein n=1 Tax=Rhizobium sp. BK602 TaxID=2586986 RepID=UPI001612DDF7|nr:hypothetical protein [Rhizobium sp. BK602]MBB3610323.1 hypothetical protein [Rhizobium sp. BK602]
METVAIDNRNDFTLWAIERAKEIVSQQGTALALAVRDGNEEDIRTGGNELGSAITTALLEVYDGLVTEG